MSTQPPTNSSEDDVQDLAMALAWEHACATRQADRDKEIPLEHWMQLDAWERVGFTAAANAAIKQLRPVEPGDGDVLVEAAQRIMWAIERRGRFNAGTADGRWHSMPKESRDRCLAAARAAMMLAKVPAGVLVDVAAERRRQIEVEGWTPEHDDQQHAGGELAVAAACYVLNGAGSSHPAPPNARPNSAE